MADFYFASNPICVSISLNLTDSVTQCVFIQPSPAAQNVHPPRSLLTLALFLGSNIFSLLAKRWLTSPAFHTAAFLQSPFTTQVHGGTRKVADAAVFYICEDGNWHRRAGEQMRQVETRAVERWTMKLWLESPRRVSTEKEEG